MLSTTLTPYLAGVFELAVSLLPDLGIATLQLVDRGQISNSAVQPLVVVVGNELSYGGLCLGQRAVTTDDSSHLEELWALPPPDRGLQDSSQSFVREGRIETL